ncbi:MAG: hypothetical protein EB127_25255 [Alphaproteobacteria bacterium]|nr:hypothetical protein [Alphaproteobacteria bacterium]
MVYENLIQIPVNTVIPPGQSVTTTQAPAVTVNPNAVPILAPNGLIWTENSNLSNGLSSRLIAGAAGINDFTIVNPYIHYATPQAGGNVIKFDPTSLLELATERFNIYSSQYRNPQ